MNTGSDDDAANQQPAVKAFCIAISDEQEAVQVDRDWLQQLACSLLQDEGFDSARISIALVDDAIIHDINRRFLQHDYPTDVISFLLNDEPLETASAAPPKTAGGTVQIDGEVLISGETAARTAADVGCPPEHELALYLVHGLLHLCGYDDQSDVERDRMREREKSHLQKSGITANYEY